MLGPVKPRLTHSLTHAILYKPRCKDCLSDEVVARGCVAEWLGSGLQIRVHRFDSGRSLFFSGCVPETNCNSLIMGNGQIGKAPDSGSGNSRFEP